MLNSADFDAIVDAPSMFRWLASDLLPELNQNMSHSIATMPSVTRTAAQCREDVNNPPWWHTAQTQSIAGARDDCDTCNIVQEPSRIGDLTFVNEYELLYQGIVLRQIPHCTLAAIKGVDDELFRRHTEVKDCKQSTQFDKVSAKAFFTAESLDGDDSTDDTNAGRLPAYGCFKFDLQQLRDDPTTPTEQREWIDRARMDKKEIFLSSSSASPAALEAAKTVLRKAAESQRVDPSTATVEISFLIMSLEFGMLTEIVLKCDFHLGGYVKTGFTMRSVVPSIFEPGGLLLQRIGPDHIFDTLFSTAI